LHNNFSKKSSCIFLWIVYSFSIVEMLLGTSPIRLKSEQKAESN